jgi:hypothetical protein
VNEISLMIGVGAATIAVEFSGCAGGLLSWGFAEATPERHKKPNDPEISQRTTIAPCTRRMSERMTSMAAGLSGLKKRNAHSSRKGKARHARREASLFVVAIC